MARQQPRRGERSPASWVHVSAVAPFRNPAERARDDRSLG